MFYFIIFGVLIFGAAPCLALTPEPAQGWLFGAFIPCKSLQGFGMCCGNCCP